MTQKCHRYFSTSNFSIPRPSLVWSHLTSHMRSHMRCHLRLFDIKWAHMSSNDVSYELKWHLIWAQMTPHMSSNETHLRFGKGRHRTAMRVRVSIRITGGVHIDHPHTTNIAGNSKRLWKFKIRFFCLIWDLKWEIEVYR